MAQLLNETQRLCDRGGPGTVRGRGREIRASLDTLCSTFGSELFAYLTTVVPSWRVCDEAWPIASDHLTGIGVKRNYGGQVMVMPWGEETSRQLARFREMLGPLSKRIVVVADDRESGDTQPISVAVTPIAVILWSRPSELAAFVIKETPD
ncbi:MAG TPA: hypothetical protein VGI19_19225 [Candidatus Cybelea sp.]